MDLDAEVMQELDLAVSGNTYDDQGQIAKYKKVEILYAVRLAPLKESSIMKSFLSSQLFRFHVDLLMDMYHLYREP